MSQEPLPQAISDYLTASEQRDVDAVVACFSDNASVFDEGKRRTGPAEIRRWREDVDTAFEYTSTVTGARALGEADGTQRYDVYLHLEGNFPGGEVDLVNSFAIRDGQIVDLRIVPATTSPPAPTTSQSRS
ncbi:nuclear transport factor 2 family protein [Mycobacterium sp. HNNTM2301]|uniref:nuclear transport factor 2 family protein n=1 Tax=Mycobacterium hainanense TaxID=3289775 RepID=UPI0035A6D5A9